MYLRSGRIQLSVLSQTGKEAIVATLGPGDFLGEGALAGHPVRLETARATMASTVLVVPKRQMIRLLHSQHALSDRFIAHMLVRNTRLEADLVDQLFNSSEKRLARTLLMLARYGKVNQPQRVVPRVSQEALAEMVGTTRSRVNFFLNKFRKLGFIKYDAGGLTINPSPSSCTTKLIAGHLPRELPGSPQAHGCPGKRVRAVARPRWPAPCRVPGPACPTA